MKKTNNILKLILFTVLLGGFAGGVIWCFLKVVALCSGLLWETLPAHSGIGFLPIICCGLGGLVVGILHKKYKDYPEELSVVMEKLQTEKYYDYRPIVPMLICAFIPLVCCSSVGPEAGLTGIIAALCYWVGDNVTYAKEHTQEFSQIGEAVTLGQLFHSPLFGIFAVEESEDGEKAVPGLSKGYKLLLYGLSTAASFLVVELFNTAFGPAMEGFPSFAEATVEPRDYALLVLYIPLGLLLYVTFEAFEKLTVQLGKYIPGILRETLCGIVIGFTALSFPMVMSSGEEQMAEMMETFSEYTPLVLLGICLGKLFMTTFCINLGMKGGHFFPLIFACTCMGFALPSLIFSAPGTHAAFAAASITATVLGAQLKKPFAAALLLLLCFPVRLLIWIFVCAAIGSSLSSRLSGKADQAVRKGGTER